MSCVSPIVDGGKGPTGAYGPATTRLWRRRDERENRLIRECDAGCLYVPTDVIDVRNLRMTIAVEGHACANSSEASTLRGTSARSTISKSNFRKNRSAVVVSRYMEGMKRRRANSIAARVRSLPRPAPRYSASTTTDR